MNDKFKGFWGFWRGLVSEKDGTPSSTRFLMLLLGAVSSAVVLILALNVRNSDVAKAALILSALPAILAALGLWMTSGYGINRWSNKKSEQLQSSPSKDGQPPDVAPKQ